MKTKTTYEVGDHVIVTSKEKMAIGYTNPHGGTSFKPTNVPFECEIINEWDDYETGQRYVGLTPEGERIYFGEFNVEIMLDTTH